MMAIELVTPAYVAKLADTLLSSLDSFPELIDEQSLVVPGDERSTWSGSELVETHDHWLARQPTANDCFALVALAHG